MPESRNLDLENLDQVLVGVIRDNQEKVVGWMHEQPGCWGFLAGKAVAACRQQAGRPLAEHERRWVWHRLWQRLEQVKRQTLGGSL
jgi:hypothetical protein